MQFHHHPLSQTKSSNLNQMEVTLSLVTEAHSEALSWKLETCSVLFIREDLAQKYFMISMALNIHTSQHNEVKLVTPVLCEDSSGVFFNQAARTSHHLQWAITCCKLAGKSRAALREAKWCLKNKTIQSKGWKRKGVITALSQSWLYLGLFSSQRLQVVLLLTPLQSRIPTRHRDLPLNSCHSPCLLWRLKQISLIDFHSASASRHNAECYSIHSCTHWQ